ncbi:MAG: hypothetical protein MI861_18845, partial [Pirellulales bacterium]|nr:hypothetical protein [Pirellulales bacterium]
GVPVDLPITPQSNGLGEISGLPANGATVEVFVQNKLLGAVTLPRRSLITVQLDADVPDTLRQLIALDHACKIVESGAEIKIGMQADADFRLTGEEQSAFAITSDHQNAQEALDDLIDRLALQQIDATGIAQASGRVVDVQVAQGQRRSISVWASLFSSAYDFEESRACPIFVARSIRWLANRPPLVPWVETGQRLPASSPELDRVIGPETQTADGRTLRSSRLASTRFQHATLPSSPSTGWLAAIHPLSWLGMLVSLLLAGEWVLYQRGRIP